ncbi:MAG TPA: hypothetical protein VKW09_14710 [bacterium]|nr:hypothetical protein [bacterium]
MIPDAMQPALREQIARELDAQIYAKIDAEVAKAEAEVWAKLPPPPILIRDAERRMLAFMPSPDGAEGNWPP